MMQGIGFFLYYSWKTGMLQTFRMEYSLQLLNNKYNEFSCMAPAVAYALQTAIASSLSSHSSFPVSASFPLAKSDMARPWSENQLGINALRNIRQTWTIDHFPFATVTGKLEKIFVQWDKGNCQTWTWLPQLCRSCRHWRHPCSPSHPLRCSWEDCFVFKPARFSAQSSDSPKPTLHVVWSCLGSRHGWAELPGSNNSCSTLQLWFRMGLIEA